MQGFAILSLIVLSPYLSSCTRASAPPAKVVVSTHLTPSELEISARAPVGHHFNLKAPYSLRSSGSSDAISPFRSNENEIRYKISKSVKTGFHLEIYLCDNANTFCKKQTAEIDWNEKTSRFLIR